MIEESQDIHQHFKDLQFIVSKGAFKQVTERIETLRRVAQAYQKDTIEMLESSLRQFVQKTSSQPGEGQSVEQIEDQLWDFVAGVRNIYRVFVSLLQQESYIGLMTEANVRDICANLSSKVQAQWMQFSRAILKAQKQDEQEVRMHRSRHSNRKNSKISLRANCVLQKWLLQNFSHPYPCSQIKSKLAKKTSLSIHQVNNWFTNARERGLKRLWRTKVQKNESDSEEN